jgi:hypothetical protein
MLSASRLYMIRWLMIWKETVLLWARYYPDICLEELRKATNNLNQDSRCLGLYSNRAPNEYKSRRLPVDQFVTVQTCYSSPWTLLSPFLISEGVTDLLASYDDLFLVSGQKTTCLFLHSVLMTGSGQGHHGKQVRSSFVKTWFFLHV